MNKQLEKVKEFMLTFGQPVYDVPTELPEDRQELRIALIFEELKEYAESSGQLDYFRNLVLGFNNDYCNTYIDKQIKYVPVINQVEQFDALLDLQYVLSGAVHEHGFGSIFDKGFDEVHRSNMSKADDNIEDATKSYNKYKEDNIEVYTFKKKIKDKSIYITQRILDDKVLKSHKYSPANLKQFL